MKTILIIFLLLLIIPTCLSVEINLHEEYKQGETFIASISGNFLSSLTKENILFYKEHVRTPFEYDLIKLGEEYYVYAILVGKKQGNYSLSLENIQYKDGNQILKDKISKNFSINDVKADFSVNPGFISTSEDFSITIQNLVNTKIDVKINTKDEINERKIFISSSEGLEESSLSLFSGEEKEINFEIGAGQPTIKKVKIESNTTSYEIPVYLLNSIEKNTLTSFRLEPSTLEYDFPTNSPITENIYLYNMGSEPINNVILSVSESLIPFVKLSQKTISNLNGNSDIPIELIISSSSEEEVYGELKAEFGETKAYSSIYITFKNDYVIPEEEVGQIVTMTCSELGGVLCGEENTKCSVKILRAKDGNCCKGECESISSSSSGRTIVIIIISLIIVVIVVFSLKKSKKSNKGVDLIKVSKVKE